MVKFVSNTKHSYSRGRVDNAYYILVNKTEGTQITTSSLNCILAACARIGLVDDAFSTFDEFDKKGITPNSDSFAYLLETLWKDLKNLKSKPTTKRNEMRQEDVNSNEEASPFKIPGSQLEAAEAILSMMKEQEIEHSPQTLHPYIGILNYFSQVEKAKECIIDAVAKKNMNIQLQTFEDMAMRYIRMGDAASANEVCDLMNKFANTTIKRDVVPLHLREEIEKLAKNEKQSK